ncbi:MAG: hypothetical protein DSY92_04465, partial [Planctomycetota bacterium]
MEHSNPHHTSSTRQETWRFFQKYSWHRVAFTLVLIAMLGTFIAIPGCGGGSSPGVIILGPTGEFLTLSDDERRAYVDA